MYEVAPPAAVVRVRIIAQYTVEVLFDDGLIGAIDLEPHLHGEEFAPLTDDYSYFEQIKVDVDAGTIAWPNGASFEPSFLYREANKGAIVRPDDWHRPQAEYHVSPETQKVLPRLFRQRPRS